MPSDSSNAHDALHDAPDSKKEPDPGSVSGELQSGKTAQAHILSEPPADAEDEGRAVLAQLQVGSVVDGKYRVDSVLGRGAMGVVVQATHLHLGERVALKFLRYKAKAGVGDDFASRFKREARVSAKLKNEHITRVIDVGVWRDHVPYMVMDYLEGTDLRQVIKGGGGPMPIALAIDYTVQVCEGIAEAHANGIVHRDLKPSNLFITKRPDGSDIIKILDFGISKWKHDEAEIDELTQTGVVLGSPKYMAPEQLFGSSEVDHRADVWSTGAILYEMLGGRPPFDMPTFTKICAELSTDRPPPSLVEKRPEIQPALEAAVMRCFERTPDKRIQNVAELAGAVLEAVDAPFADAVRARIAATLEPKSARDALAASGGSMVSGSYSAMLTGSTTGRKVVAFPPPPAPGTLPEPIGATTLGPASIPPFKKSRKGLWLVPLALVVVGGALFFAFGGKDAEPPSTASTASVAAPSQPPATPATMTATAAITTAAATASTAVATAPTTPTAPAATATEPPPPGMGPGMVHAPWRGRVPRFPGPVAAQPPNTAAPPPAATTAAPVATTPPAATAKPDPLGDRQ